MGIYDSVMDIALEGICFGLSYHYECTASQQIHDANNVITSKQC